MMHVLPTVLHFIVCERVRPAPHNLQALNIEGLKWSIRSKEKPAFPCHVPFLTVLTVFIGGKGDAKFAFRVIEDGSRKIISESESAKLVQFIGNPQQVFGMKSFLQNCEFPRPGLYWVELLVLGTALARQPLHLEVCP